MQEDRWNAYQAQANNSLDGYLRVRKGKEEEVRAVFQKIAQNPKPYYDDAVAKQRLGKNNNNNNNNNSRFPSQQQQQQQQQSQRQQR